MGVEMPFDSVGGGMCGECSVLLHNVVLQVTVQDTWRWLLDPIHGYSVRGAYHFITTSRIDADIHLVDSVVWHLLRDRLPTKDNLARRWVIQATDTACLAACGNLETTKHLFLGCDIHSSLWSLVLH